MQEYNHRDPQRKMEDNELTGSIIRLAIDVHNALDPGLLESAYKECLFYKLVQANLLVAKERGMPLVFKSVKLECGYRIDLLVENRIVVEVKSVEALTDIHLAQTLTYLKLGKFRLGIN